MAAATNRQVQIRQAVDAAISAAQVREKRPYIPDERAMNRSQKSPKCTVNSLYRMVNRDPRKSYEGVVYKDQKRRPTIICAARLLRRPAQAAALHQPETALHTAEKSPI